MGLLSGERQAYARGFEVLDKWKHGERWIRSWGGPTGLKWVIQYTPTVIYIHIHIYIYINMDLEYRHLEKYGIIWFVYGL